MLCVIEFLWLINFHSLPNHFTQASAGPEGGILRINRKNKIMPLNLMSSVLLMFKTTLINPGSAKLLSLRLDFGLC